jgi:hypothetical protein
MIVLPLSVTTAQSTGLSIDAMHLMPKVLIALYMLGFVFFMFRSLKEYDIAKEQEQEG